MKSILFTYQETATLSLAQLDPLLNRLKPEMQKLTEAKTLHYSTPYAFINLPFDTAQFDLIQLVIEEKKKLNPHLVLVIGMGGSLLGTKALCSAVDTSNSFEKKILFIDTIDPVALRPLYIHVEQILKAGHSILITIVTKSGTTLETLANAQLFVDLLRRYHPRNYGQYVIAITQENSPLWHRAHDEGFTSLSIPTLVGGRYSVFSPVGLFPLGLLGIDTAQLLAGAQQATNDALDTNPETNTALRRAALLYAHYCNQISIENLFLFTEHLHAFGSWYQQLIAESLGKSGKGILPIVSRASRDLHSMLQLYLGGPRNHNTTFITVKTFETDIEIVHSDIFQKSEVQKVNVTFAQLLQAQTEGIINTYKKHALPFSMFEISHCSPWTLGWLMQTCMLQTVYLGTLLGVNPFDQPEVQASKQATLEALKINN